MEWGIRSNSVSPALMQVLRVFNKALRKTLYNCIDPPSNTFMDELQQSDTHEWVDMSYIYPSSVENMKAINSAHKMKTFYLVEVMKKDDQFKPEGQDSNFDRRRWVIVREKNNLKDEDKNND